MYSDKLPFNRSFADELIKLTVEKTSFPDWDWWVLRREEHDGKVWEEHFHDTCWWVARMRSDRLVPQSDVEGPSEEWLAIAEAIEEGTDQWFDRVAVNTLSSGVVEIWSPKQLSMMGRVKISKESALYLAANIRHLISR